MSPFFTAELATLHHRDLIDRPNRRRPRPGHSKTLRSDLAERTNSI